MIVLINDETHLSDWCTFEWETARELEIPVRVIVDLERGNKAECLAHAAAFPSLLRFQVVQPYPYPYAYSSPTPTRAPTLL